MSAQAAFKMNRIIAIAAMAIGVTLGAALAMLLIRAIAAGLVERSVDREQDRRRRVGAIDPCKPSRRTRRLLQAQQLIAQMAFFKPNDAPVRAVALAPVTSIRSAGQRPARRPVSKPRPDKTKASALPKASGGDSSWQEF